MRRRQQEEERLKLQKQLENETRIREQFKQERERKQTERQAIFNSASTSINPFFTQKFVSSNSSGNTNTNKASSTADLLESAASYAAGENCCESSLVSVCVCVCV